MGQRAYVETVTVWLTCEPCGTKFMRALLFRDFSSDPQNG